MASVIKIKRSSTGGSAPSSLEAGELAVNLFDRKLFVGNSTGVTAITADDATTTTKGVASFSSDNFAVSSGAVTIKDGGVVTAELANDAVTNAKLANDAVDSDQIADGAVDTVHIADSNITSAKLAAGAVTTAKIADAQITAAKVAATGLTANTLASNAVETAKINAKAVTTAKIADAAITAAKIAAGGIVANTIGNNSVALGTKTTGNYVATIAATANETSVSGSGSETATVTVGLADNVTIPNNLTVTGNTAVSGNITVDGNLTVEGSTTYISSSTVQVDDSQLKLSANNAADTVDTGVYAKYVVSGNSAVQFTGYFRDASDSGTFKFFTGLDVEPTTTVNTGDTGFSLAQVDAIIDGGTY